MTKLMTAGQTAITATNFDKLAKDVKIVDDLTSETICEDTSLEIWRDVEGFEGRYEVSCLGYLRFADKPVKRLVKCTQYGDYFRATLKNKGDDKPTNIAIHILVATAFVPNPEGYTFVRHKNGRLQDNRADNLEWVENRPVKEKKEKSKRTSKVVTTSPVLEVSDAEVPKDDVLERDILECDVAGGYVPSDVMEEVEMPLDEEPLEGDVPEEELWKDVKGFEGLYKISKSGMVLSFRRKKPICLSPMRASHLLAYQLKDKDGKRHCKFAHILVAENFIPNPFGYKYVMHMDRNPKNNNVDHLRWTERSVRYREEGSESYKELEGKHNLRTTQAVEQYYTDGTYITTFKSIGEAAKKTKYSCGSIKKVLDGKEPSVGGYVWKYSGNVYQTQVNRTIVEEHISKVSLPNWINKVDKFITFFNETTSKVTNVVKSVFGNFQYTSVMPW